MTESGNTAAEGRSAGWRTDEATPCHVSLVVLARAAHLTTGAITGVSPALATGFLGQLASSGTLTAGVSWSWSWGQRGGQGQGGEGLYPRTARRGWAVSRWASFPRTGPVKTQGLVLV